MEGSIKVSNTVKWLEDKHYLISSAGKPEVDVATPARFGGRDDFWSPLDLLVASLNACVLSTFVAISEKLGARFISYESEAVGELERSGGVLKFANLVVRPTITVESESEAQKVRHAIEAAKKHCPISLSLNATVHIEPTIKVV